MSAVAFRSTDPVVSMGASRRETSHGCIRSLRRAALFALCSLWAFAHGQSPTRVEARELRGKDPAAFADAEELYAGTKGAPMDTSTSDGCVDTLRNLLAKAKVGSEEFWEDLETLRTRRIHPSRVGRLLDLADLPSMRIVDPRRSTSDADEAFLLGNQSYESKQFRSAISSYEDAIRFQASHWDAWNNLGLAALHEHEDAFAALVLAILRKNKPEYAPAGINLTVAVERLGNSRLAGDIAIQTRKRSPAHPMSAYNVAWFENAKGNFTGSTTILDSLGHTDTHYHAPRWLQGMNDLERSGTIRGMSFDAIPEDRRPSGAPTPRRLAVGDSRLEVRVGDSLLGILPQGSSISVATTSGDWTGFYSWTDSTRGIQWVRTSEIEDPGFLRGVFRSLGDGISRAWSWLSVLVSSLIEDLGGK
ncbi:MAG TPA: hypothetical protein PKO15_04585 [Fibrobacteria bacterium]|nr:hypothetical protein [Fibrobacteria bacterium]